MTRTSLQWRHPDECHYEDCAADATIVIALTVYRGDAGRSEPFCAAHAAAGAELLRDVVRRQLEQVAARLDPEALT